MRIIIDRAWILIQTHINLQELQNIINYARNNILFFTYINNRFFFNVSRPTLNEIIRIISISFAYYKVLIEFFFNTLRTCVVY